MSEVTDECIDLYGFLGQIGYGQTLREYLKDLYYVWKECYRVLRKGGRFCLNIGDQFARSIIYGRYKVIPIHAEFIAQCEQLSFDFMGSIIWQKKTTMNTTGGANIMGSFPYPPNGIVEIDYEFIHILKNLLLHLPPKAFGWIILAIASSPSTILGLGRSTKFESTT
jgi:DNA modification methylase